MSPITGDSREESPAHTPEDEELLQPGEEPGEESEVEEEPYQLDVLCNKNGKHDRFFCCCVVQGMEFPIPPPPRVHHPTLGIGLLSPDHSDRNSSCYEFVYNGEEHLIECFN
jgi:hypothetical protein